MQIIPVLDLKHGVVVRGVAGDRDRYAPVESRLTDSSAPLEVARAIRAEFGLDRIYVADLDAIMSQAPNVDVWRTLKDDGFQLLIDAGIRDFSDARRVRNIDCGDMIVALETIPGPELLDQLFTECGIGSGGGGVYFSLDLQDGRPLGRLDAWPSNDPLEIAARAVDAGISSMIVLDLASVGADGGVSTLDLCQEIHDRHPQVALVTGGGIRNGVDLRKLASGPIDGVLIASALHDGRITRKDARDNAAYYSHTELP